MLVMNSDYYRFFNRVLDSLVGGGSVTKALKALAREGYEVRRHVYMQCSSNFVDKNGRSRTCQWNPMTIFIQRMDEEYGDFQYGYRPTKLELMELLEGVLKYDSFLNYGLELEIEPDVF
jgi:hypothetical protein